MLPFWYLAAPASVSDDTQSDGDDLSVQDESGTETTEGDIMIDSSSSSSPEYDQDSGSIRISPPDTPVASKIFKREKNDCLARLYKIKFFNFMY